MLLLESLLSANFCIWFFKLEETGKALVFLKKIVVIYEHMELGCFWISLGNVV